MRATAVLAVMAILVAAAPALADVVTLENGDRVSGTIKLIREGKLIIETAYAGEVPIDYAVVTGIETDGEIPVFLASGDRVTGKVEVVEPGKLRVVSASGAVNVAVADVKGLHEPVTEDGRPLSEVEAELAKLSSPTGTWAGNLELGGALSDGNTDVLSGFFRLTLTRETPGDKFTFRAAARYAEENGNKIVDEQILSLREDVKLDPWYVFALLSFERDQFEDLDLRGIFAPGAGIRFVDEEKLKMDFEAAPTLRYSDYRSRESEWAGELLLGHKVDWNPFGEARVTSDLQLFPSLTQGGEFRLQWEGAIEQPVAEGWFARLSIVDKYNSDPSPGFEKNDFTIRLALVYKF
jgi:putative salt-induced outer membrane protein